MRSGRRPGGHGLDTPRSTLDRPGPDLERRDLRTVTNAKNPALAVNSDGTVGLLFQQLAGAGSAARWVTQLELTDDNWQASSDHHGAPHRAGIRPAPGTGLPYLGDYIRLLAVGRDFYGVFSGSNRPDPGKFPLRRHLPAQRQLGSAHAAQHRQRITGPDVHRPLLRPLHALSDRSEDPAMTQQIRNAPVGHHKGNPTPGP